MDVNSVEYALSNFDIIRLFNGNINIVKYEDINKYNNIDELFNPVSQACVILYQIEKKFGHWACMFKNPKKPKMIYYFCSYGIFTDKQLKYISNKKWKKDSNQDYPYLLQLINDSPYTLDYNDLRFQKMNENIATCGRWVVYRIMNRNLTNKQFYDKIKSVCKKFKITPDEFVTLMVKL